MTYRIDVLAPTPSQSAPYDTLEDALEAATEYSVVWERDAGLTYHICDEATDDYVAFVVAGETHMVHESLQ